MRNQKSRILKVLVVIACLTALILTSKTITSPFRIKMIDLLSSSLKGADSFLNSFRRIMPFAALREENRLLRARIDLLNRKIEELKIVSSDNDRLKELLNFRKTIPFTTIPAQVIGRDPSNWSNSIIIDKGLSGGIKQNKAVLSTKGLVGRVLEVGRYSSKILLITDPNSKVGVMIQRNRQGGILVGRPDSRCRMIYIALDSDVMPGDRVITAGFGTIFPKDIIVGEVVRVDKEPGRLYKSALIKTAEDLSKLEEVMCIR
ncbi:MAG: rod shape-determining protein MreC [Candidatus Omnitrophica bacterium]|nr:rod shape-determining protein MreC [Candidatus Omnitrophota bacterium]MDD5436386.1 rod shape-determining protein MreC [Candidatus Omnitrophota bacterium]